MNSENAFQIDVNFDRLIAWVVIGCLAVEAIILVLDVLMNLAELWYFEKFKVLSDVAQEKSFGTWFSVVLNFMAAITALVISSHFRFVSVKKSRFWGWLIVALFFAYISLDDHLVLHERVGGTLGPIFFNWLLGSERPFGTYEWIFMFGPIFGAFGVFFLIFLYRELGAGKQRVFLVSGLSLWALAVLMDAWEGTSHPYNGIIAATGFKELHVRHFFMLIEELIEMVGSTVFLYLFLSHTRNLYTKG